ncbi:MAG: 16S rRNA processing protein RimM [Deltaproteobacteria bacterium]|nr:16S rRNA processing protein RimM [Deltaproteobacteria bacterium]
MGRLVNTHGVRGELRLLPYAFPCPTLQKSLAVSLQGKTGPAHWYTLESVRPHAPFVLVRLQGVNSLEQAQALHGAVVSVEEDRLPPLREGEFYYYQAIGLHVFTTAGEPIGTIAQVFFSGGHDIWVVRQGKKEYLLPVTEEVVRTIDIPGGRAIIEPIEGLLEQY